MTPAATISPRMDPDELRKRLGLPSTDSVYRAARNGFIPHTRLGRRRLFFREVIEAWLREPGNAQSNSSISPPPERTDDE